MGKIAPHYSSPASLIERIANAKSSAMIPNHKRSFIATALASALTFTAAYAPTPAAGGPPTPESRIQALIPKLEAYIHA